MNKNIPVLITFPQPGGPQSIIEGISSASSRVLSRLFSPSTFDCPTYSAKVFGRILSASGRNWLFFDFWPSFFPEEDEVELWPEMELLVPEGRPGLFSVLLGSDLELFGASFCFNLLEGGFASEFPAKFEKLLDKLLFRVPVAGLVINELLTFLSLLLPKKPDDLCNKLPFPKGGLFIQSGRLFVPGGVHRFSFGGEASFAFRHLFTCSFTEEAEKKLPQIGQSTWLACDIANHTNSPIIEITYIFRPTAVACSVYLFPSSGQQTSKLRWRHECLGKVKWRLASDHTSGIHA